MIAMRLARAALLLFTLGWAFIAAAQVPVPPLTGHVTDQTTSFTAEQKATLEQTLQTFEARKGSQLAVLIVATTAPEAIEQYAVRVAERWKLGRKKVDDGAILVVAKNDRAVRIEVGYGLEGALNDAISKRIVSESITPRFTQGDFYGGVTAGIDQIIRVVDGESLPQRSEKPNDGVTSIQQLIPVIFILALVMGGVLRSLFGRFPGALATGGVVAVVAWLFAGAISIALVSGLMALVFTLLSGGLGGHGFRGHRGGGYGTGGFGGRGGGGFSGGGGGFGGGGATGRW